MPNADPQLKELAAQSALRHSHPTALPQADQRPVAIGTRRAPRKRQAS